MKVTYFAALLLCSAGASATHQPAVLASPAAGGAAQSTAMLSISYTSEPTGVLRAQLFGGAGPRFALAMSADPAGGSFVWLGAAPLDANGDGTVTANLDFSQFGDAMMYFSGTYVTPAGRVSTPWRAFGTGVSCQRLNFNFDQGGNELAPGTKIDEQWNGVGVHISAQGNAPNSPDQVIIFDSENPTGGDSDLITPGYGTGNDAPLGNVLIIAEDVVDLDNDSLVDDPDDAAAGGTIFFDFDAPVAVCSLSLLDLDETGIGSIIRFFDGQTMIGEIDLPSMDDNSFQDVEFLFQGVTRVEVSFTGSGAIPFMGVLPCPFRINLDFNSFGEPSPLYLPGLIVDDELDSLGAIPSAENNTPGHPDLLTIFDTSNPTGGDFDLQTPGFGPGNDVAQEYVLIIAENDGNANGDKLIDDPDDEAFGGTISLQFSYDWTFQSATVLDVDGNESSSIALYDAGGNLLAQLKLANLGDNSSQTVNTDVPNVRRFELVLGGSGALAELVGCPEFGATPGS